MTTEQEFRDAEALEQKLTAHMAQPLLTRAIRRFTRQAPPLGAQDTIDRLRMGAAGRVHADLSEALARQAHFDYLDGIAVEDRGAVTIAGIEHRGVAWLPVTPSDSRFEAAQRVFGPSQLGTDHRAVQSILFVGGREAGEADLDGVHLLARMRGGGEQPHVFLRYDELDDLPADSVAGLEDLIADLSSMNDARWHTASYAQSMHAAME